MSHQIKLITYPVTNLDQAKTLFSTLLGTEPYIAGPYYAGFRIGDFEVGLVPNGHRQGMTGPISYAEVDDIHGTLQSLLDAGATTHQEVNDVGGGLLVAAVKDADGNILGLRKTP